MHDFPGMLRSLDCLHWAWACSPNPHKGQYTRGDHGYPTVILEAVASQDMWICHAFFGSVGSLNDINVLNMSPLLDDMYNGTAPDSSFQVAGTSYRNRYYLVDGIYLEHAYFVKSLSCLNDWKRLKFKRAQERARNDVERAFGALKKRWHILKYLASYMEEKKMSEVMYTCIILHNMILEDEGNTICEYNENEIVPPTQAFEVGSAEYTSRRALVNDVGTHHVLRRDLMERIWNVNHIDLNTEPVSDLEGQFSDEDVL
ncbi:unnamed protein product [Lactuca virosa]|uniref:Protein ALP1-like n=1 Tax=Lactuca virosa TaxID=75947 RepID=A0AAU9P2D0_9ASTR|nr:unnamed protein product [Lactuca virosa]